MGRSYWFECSRCGYRATVSGGADRGLDFHVQTILCRDCGRLYDAVTRLRLREPPRPKLNTPTGRLAKSSLFRPWRAGPPSFEAALNRLRVQELGRFRWLNFQPLCPVSKSHKVQSWKHPGACPKCGLTIDKNALPFRIWD